MIEKEFITQEMIRDASLKLAEKMYKEDGFFPDIIYDSLRGGAYMANVISEYYKIVGKKIGKSLLYAAVVARSYGSVREHSNHVDIVGWSVSPESLDKNSKVLVVDDIFDTGMTVNELVNALTDVGLKRENIKVAVYDYKIYHYKKDEKLPIQPDYYSRRHDIYKPEDSKWIHYTMHEFIGLSDEEIDKLYEDEDVKRILKEILS